MRKRFVKKIMTVVLAASVALQGAVFPASFDLPSMTLTSYADSGFVNTDRLNVRSGPGTSYDKVATIGAGTQVSILGETTGTDGNTWYNISYGSGSGYARHDFISRNVTYAANDGNFEDWMNRQGFPESYKNGLRGLHQQYPNWVFTAFQTGLDWNTVIAEESRIGRNLVDKNSISSWKSIADGAFDWAGNYWPGFDGATWVQASTELISYYMDPRNFLTDPYVFQFEHQSYNRAIQTREGLQNLVSGTFLAGDVVVPVEGSQIEGGTIIDGSTSQGSSGAAGMAGPGPGSSSSTGTSSSGSGYAVVGGGSYISSGSSGSSDSGYVTVGPGMSSGSSGADAAMPSPVNNDIVSLTGPGMNSSDAGSFDTADRGLFSLLKDAAGLITSYAAQWRQETEPNVRWVYVNDDGSYLNDGWHWLDGNHDGIAECYYFYSDGTMAADTEVDGWKVNADGKWVHGNGEPYTKNVGGSSAGDTTSSSSSASQAAAGGSTGGTLKKVSYVDIIMKAAEVSNVSPYVLAAAILQEQGKGTSDLISGKHSKYPGYYNYFNTGAYAHDGMGAVEAGLKYASESGNGGRPWNTVEKAIIGGASAYGASYVAQGQDTFYLKKFNVQGSNKYNHQFMTHVLGAAQEGAKVSNAYSAAVKSGALEFSIPVYQNMPENSVLPAGDGNPNNKLSGLSVDGYTITPTFSMDTTEYTLIVDGSSAYVNINASPIDSGATVSGAGNVALNVGANDINIVVRAANGSERTYHIGITRREDYSGQAAAGSPSPVISGSTDSGGAAWVSNGSAESAAGPGMIISSGSGTTQDSGYAVIGPGSTQTTIQNSGDSGNGGVLIGAGPQ